MMLQSVELALLAASGAAGSLSNIRGGAPLPPPAFLFSSLLPLTGAAGSELTAGHGHEQREQM